MKTLFLAFLVCLLAIVVVAADPPTQISFPRCGMNTVISSIASSGCGMTDLPCLCKAPSFLKMANGGIAKACKNQKELETYVAFINAQCFGKQGFPVDAKAMASGATRSVNTGNMGIWSMLVTAGLAALHL